MKQPLLKLTKDILERYKIKLKNMLKTSKHYLKYFINKKYLNYCNIYNDFSFPFKDIFIIILVMVPYSFILILTEGNLLSPYEDYLLLTKIANSIVYHEFFQSFSYYFFNQEPFSLQHNIYKSYFIMDNMDYYMFQMFKPEFIIEIISSKYDVIIDLDHILYHIEYRLDDPNMWYFYHKYSEYYDNLVKYLK